MALVVLPTAISAFIAMNSPQSASGIWLAITLLTFVVTSFLAGGAITLVDIARNTRALVERAYDASAPAAPAPASIPAPPSAPREPDPSQLNTGDKLRAWLNKAPVGYTPTR